MFQSKNFSYTESIVTDMFSFGQFRNDDSLFSLNDSEDETRKPLYLLTRFQSCEVFDIFIKLLFYPKFPKSSSPRNMALNAQPE